MNASAAQRSRARHYCMQSLYQWQLTGKSLPVIEAEFHSDVDMSKVDQEYYHETFKGAVERHKELDELIKPCLKNIEKDALDPVTLALLRLAVFELSQRMDVPYRVVINESINLAKKFGAEDSHKFVNGVLDKLVPRLRAEEAKQSHPKKSPSSKSEANKKAPG